MSDVLIVNVATGERTERDFTPEEAAQHAKDKADAEAEAQAKADALAEREAALESGKAKLLALGLTEDEVAAMTNG